MPDFSDLARPILVAISQTSGENYSDIEEEVLTAELKRLGHEPNDITLRNIMNALKDAGYVEFYAGATHLSHIRLDEAGRQEVEGWPKIAGISATDVEALLSVLQARSDDPALSDPERNKARAVLAALQDLGTQVTGEIFAAWLRAHGIPG
jgi:hypothetical protein